MILVLNPVLGIRDILVRIWIPGSVPLTNGDPDPTPDPTPFFSDLRMEKNNFFHIFSFNFPTVILFSVLKISFFAQILCLNFILTALFQSAQHIYEKKVRIQEAQKPPDPDRQHC
jgi:hypothetical protein